jgi:hypothetical protein
MFPLLVDVDGAISLFGFDHTDPPPAFPVAVDGIPHWREGAHVRVRLVHGMRDRPPSDSRGALTSV